MKYRFPRPSSVFSFWAGLAALLALIACGDFALDPQPSNTPNTNRRIYVNDGAAADSLTPTLVRSGIKFILQPGKAYQLSVSTARTKDHLSVFYYSPDLQGQYKSLAPTLAAGSEVFDIVSDRKAAQQFVAQLVVPDGLGAINSLGHVSLISKAAIGADTLNLRLLFIRKLRNLPDSGAKATFSKKLFAAMAPIYSPFGIVLKGTFAIVEPNGEAVKFPFSNAFVPLPGTRVANNAHIYMVDTITIGDPGSGLKGQVLGFAPREVADLDQDPQSRVLLANPYSIDSSVTRAAITVAHELGHFFGLRHTVSTQHDLLQDDDESNIEDGFTDTKFCVLDTAKAIAKASAAPTWVKKGGPVYCLRMADNSCNAQVCDLRNLMYPIDCNSQGQTVLSSQQATFLKKNLATFRR